MVPARFQPPDDKVSTVSKVSKGKGEAISPLAASLAELERHRPDRVEVAAWQHAIEGGRRFLILWGNERLLSDGRLRTCSGLLCRYEPWAWSGYCTVVGSSP
jgi:hypothetical protein